MRTAYQRIKLLLIARFKVLEASLLLLDVRLSGHDAILPWRQRF
jgi:hypothetical protein